MGLKVGFLRELYGFSIAFYLTPFLCGYIFHKKGWISKMKQIKETNVESVEHQMKTDLNEIKKINFISCILKLLLLSFAQT